MPVWRRAPEARHANARARNLDADVAEAPRFGARLDAAAVQLDQTVAAIEGLARTDGVRALGSGDARANARAASLNEAQTELVADVVDVRDRGLSPTPAAQRDFLPGPVAALWEEFHAWVRRVAQLFSPTVAIESTAPMGARALARTIVTASGDFHSAYGSLDRRMLERHRQDVAEALHERNQALRSVAIAVGAAIKIALLLATPALGIKAIIAAVWKFVREFLR